MRADYLLDARILQRGWLSQRAKIQIGKTIQPLPAAALKWLALTDGGGYSQSWDQASSVFQRAITRDAWIHALVNARQPLGKIISREVNSARYTQWPPAAPEGEYVSILYYAQFEQKAAASEFITVFREKDGSWKVSGYFIK
jgi:hypothetical protein